MSSLCGPGDGGGDVRPLAGGRPLVHDSVNPSVSLHEASPHPLLTLSSSSPHPLLILSSPSPHPLLILGPLVAVLELALGLIQNQYNHRYSFNEA